MAEKYYGYLDGNPVEFNRVFRGYRFTDEECERLCRGDTLVVDRVRGSGGDYGLKGHLEDRVFDGARGPVHIVRFVCDDIYPPGVKKRIDDGGYLASDEDLILPKRTRSDPERDRMYGTDEWSDAFDRQLAAMVASPALPHVETIYYGDSDEPDFEPSAVLEQLAYMEPAEKLTSPVKRKRFSLVSALMAKARTQEEVQAQAAEETQDDPYTEGAYVEYSVPNMRDVSDTSGTHDERSDVGSGGFQNDENENSENFEDPYDDYDEDDVPYYRNYDENDDYNDYLPPEDDDDDTA